MRTASVSGARPRGDAAAVGIGGAVGLEGEGRERLVQRRMETVLSRWAYSSPDSLAGRSVVTMPVIRVKYAGATDSSSSSKTSNIGCRGNVDPRAVADGLLDGVVSQHDEAERIGGCRLDPVAAHFVGFRMAVGVLFTRIEQCASGSPDSRRLPSRRRHASVPPHPAAAGRRAEESDFFMGCGFRLSQVTQKRRESKFPATKSGGGGTSGKCSSARRYLGWYYRPICRSGSVDGLRGPGIEIPGIDTRNTAVFDHDPPADHHRSTSAALPQ